MEKEIKHSFLKGAIILSVGMVFVKSIGAFFKLPLANIITENGMGFFNTAYNFYAVFFSLATAGFPVAIAKLVAENYSVGRYNDVKMVKKTAMPIFVVLGVISTSVMILGAKAYTGFIGNQGAYLPIVVLAPTIFFCCLSSIYRGYFEGLRNMYPTAISEVIEAVCKLCLGLWLSKYIVDYLSDEYAEKSTMFGVFVPNQEALLVVFSYAAAGAILGVTVGSLLSFLYLVIKYKITGGQITLEMQRNSPKPQSRRLILKRLLSFAIPVAIGSLALSIAGLIDQTFLQRRISNIINTSPEVILDMYRGQIPNENIMDISTIPNYLFGAFAYAVTIFMLVPSATQAFAISALPNLTSAWVKKDRNEINQGLNTVIKTTCICCFPAGLGLFALSKPIVRLLYGNSISLNITSDILTVLAIASIFSALATPLSAVLQSVGKIIIPVKILIFGLIIKITLNYVLCAIPQINIHGAGISTLACYLFITIVQFVVISKIPKCKIYFVKSILKPFFCAIICVVTAYFSYEYFIKNSVNQNISCIIAIVISGFAYVLALILSKTVEILKIKH